MTGFRAQDLTLAGRVAGFLLQNRATRLDWCNIQIQQLRQDQAQIRGDPTRPWPYLVRFEEIQAYFGEISTIFGEIWWDSRRSKPISVRAQPYLVRSSKIQGDPSLFWRFSEQMYWVFEDSGDICRIRQLSKPTEHYPNPKLTRPIDVGGRFRVPPPSTQRWRVGSRLGQKPTRPDSWTALLATKPIFSKSRNLVIFLGNKHKKYRKFSLKHKLLVLPQIKTYPIDQSIHD